MKTFYCFLLLLPVASCEFPSGSDKNYSDVANTTYFLQLKPAPGSSYHYDITSTTEVQMEVDDREINNLSKSTAGILYTISKDSNGFLFNMKYDKLHLYTKNGETETELDAGNGRMSLNPAEKMLAFLKEANLTATVTPTGVVKKIDGYEQLSAQLLSTLDANDINARQIAQKHLDKLIGQEMV